MKLIEFRREKSNIKDKNFCVIYDNASIHKAKSIANFACHKKISMLTIPPYCPTLNAAEKLILSIKKKICKYNDEGRMTTYSLVAHVADEISSSGLKGYVDACFKESYEYLLQNN